MKMFNKIIGFSRPVFQAETGAGDDGGWTNNTLDSLIDNMPDGNEDDEEDVDSQAETGDTSTQEADEAGPDHAPEEQAREGEQEQEGEDGKSQAGTIDPPVMWTDQAKAIFAEAKPELQQYILEREQQQQAEITRRQMEAAELRKNNEAITNVAQNIAGMQQSFEDMFDGKWKGITQNDWDKLAYANPQQHQLLRAEFEAEQQAVQKVRDARQVAEQQAKTQWVQNETNALLSAHPELGNKDNLGALITFAKQNGLTDQELDGLNAKGFGLIYALKNATLENQRLKAQLNSKQVLQQNQQSTQTKTSLKPSRTVAVSKDSSAIKSFRQNPTRDNLANLL